MKKLNVLLTTSLLGLALAGTALLADTARAKDPAPQNAEPTEAKKPAQRELKEETGFTGGEWQELMVIAPNSSTMNNHCHCFVVRNVEKTSGQHLDATEDLDYFLKDENEVFDMLQRGEFHQAMMVAALWKFFCWLMVIGDYCIYS